MDKVRGALVTSKTQPRQNNCKVTYNLYNNFQRKVNNNM